MNLAIPIVISPPLFLPFPSYVNTIKIPLNYHIEWYYYGIIIGGRAEEKRFYLQGKRIFR